MNAANLSAYNDMIRRINSMSLESQDALVAADRCPFEPEHLIGVPLGMFHCEVCGEMVLAGFPHPRQQKGGRDDT